MVRTLADLKSYSRAWNDLAVRSAQQVPMLSYAWISSYFEHQLEDGESWVCIFALEDDRLVGVLPLIQKEQRLLGYKIVRLRTPANPHTFCVDFLAEPNQEEQIIRFLIATLDQTIPKWFDLYLKWIPGTSPTLRTVTSGIPGVIVRSDLGGDGAYIHTTGDFEQYKTRLSKKLRQTLRHHKNLLGGETLTTWFGNDRAELAQRFDEFLRLEASGWKGQAKTAIKTDEKLLRFYTALVERLSQAGWLDWQFLFIGDRPIASSLGARFGQTVFGFKIGYDPDYAKVSPGHLLCEKLIERCFATPEIREINFLSRMKWLESWRVQYRNYYDLRIFPRRFIPLLLGLLPAMLRDVAARSRILKKIYHRLRKRKD